MPAIKAEGSKNLIVKNCSFSGFETDIELMNVDGFLSENNTFSQSGDPKIIIPQLIKAIQDSGLDDSSKKRLFKDIFSYLSNKGNEPGQKVKLEERLKVIGDKAADFFVQLAANVAAGLIISMK